MPPGICSGTPVLKPGGCAGNEAVDTQARATENQEVGKWPKDTHWGGIGRNWTERKVGQES